MLAIRASFKEFISKELYKANSSLPFEIKEYLSDLLYFYISTHRIYEYRNQKGKSYKTTLVEIYGKIPAAGANERVYLFKKIGDLSLYLSGFFRSALKEDLVDRSYYEDMGEAAYGRLSTLYRKQNNIFKSLARNFKPLSETLFHIQKKTEARQPLPNKIFSF